MFTGLVEEVGIISDIRKSGDGRKIRISCKKVVEDIKVKESISVSGICLTVVGVGTDYFEVDVVSETLKRSNIGRYTVNDKVNLERALMLSDRLGGHIVQGHVDGVATVISHDHGDNGSLLIIDIPKELREFVVEKGSITLDGISLTVASVKDTEVSVALIPHTLEITTMGERVSGDSVNVEVDVLAKYVKNMMKGYTEPSSLTLEKLQDMGY